MKLSIVIVTRERRQDMIECLDSIFRAPPHFPFEVIVVFNGPCDYIDHCEKNYSIKSLKLHTRLFPGSARNEALSHASGEYTLFLDDDCTLPIHYFKKIDFHNWDVLGGPDQSPPESTPLQFDIGYSLSSPLCMGPTRKRHSRKTHFDPDASEINLILCNLIFKTSLFTKEDFKFNDHLMRNEENFLLKELKEKEKIIHYNPDLFVYHKRKSDWSKLGAAIESSGKNRVLNFFMKPKLTELFYLGPLLYCTFLISLAALDLKLFLAIELSYTAMIVAYSLINFRKINANIILIHHFIVAKYAYGSLLGILNFQMIFKENKSLIKESKIK